MYGCHDGRLYLGELAAKDPTGVFRLVSRDSGFDPLIAHLQQRGLNVARRRDLGDNPRSALDPEPTP